VLAVISKVISRSKSNLRTIFSDFVALLSKTPETKQLREAFFREEYKLNYLTGNYKLPYIAIISGITMGGVSLCLIQINHSIDYLGLWSFCSWTISNCN